MRVIICGGRDYQNRERVYAVLDEIKPLVVAHGGARGADALAEQWAVERGVTCHPFPADWKTHGRAAGPIRNGRMLASFKPDAVIAFPGGKGTQDMVQRAQAAGIKVVEVTE